MNDSLPLISVIIPVYNVANYLHECVDSVLAQSYPNLEIVLVDDGSSDSCGSICDDYALLNPNVVALHKRNGGLSDARNFGLRHAKGDLISFVDSDDWVSPLFIEALYTAMREYGTRISTVPFGSRFRDGDEVCLVSDHASVQSLKRSVLEPHTVIRMMLYQAIGTGAPWRLYDRGLLDENPFPAGLYYEDLATMYKFVHRAGSVAYIDTRDLYAYRLRATSIIRQTYKPLKARSALKVADQLYRDITTWYPDLAAAAASRCFSVCRMVYAQVPTGRAATEGTEHDRGELWALLKRHRTTVVRDAHARKRERLAAGIACLGRTPFDLFCKTARKAGLLQ